MKIIYYIIEVVLIRFKFKLDYNIYVVHLAFFEVCMVYKTNVNLPRTQKQIWPIGGWNTEMKSHDFAYFIL